MLSACPTGLLLVIAFQLCQISAVYLPLREYAGATFFDGWDYWGNVDNTTWGNVTYLDQTLATEHRLAYVNAAGNAIVKVDNSTTIAAAPLVNRESIRLTTKDSYGVGTLWIIDAVHIPYGCSVWPAFWTLGVGKEWPNAGEIDIIEAINLMDNNQMALHSTKGCFQSPNPVQSGATLATDCSLDRGCIVAERKPNSFGAGFAQAGGGVFAVQMDITGVFMWFWPRQEVPDSIKTATSQSSLDIATFGVPSSAYPALGCNITEFFGPQQLVLLTTLCGVWAGTSRSFGATCSGRCVDQVIGPGTNFDTAYWEVPYIRTYIAEGLPRPELSSSTTPTPTDGGSPTSTTSASGTQITTPPGNVNTSAAGHVKDLGVVRVLVGITAVLCACGGQLLAMI
ncbi:putative glycosidase C21B10.07 [Hypsizygus marmoreus]|uniref:Glycosidase C21B10.07 n=1 Tax=Hypsizygus marmoreus TaxID=39966 RepID=A0A369JKZ7_HYPMA|nr:putative glycosidase C21B10.07 [Hypsizygus marmoreus]